MLELIRKFCNDININPNISPELRKISNFFLALEKMEMQEFYVNDNQYLNELFEIFADDLNTVEKIKYQDLLYAAIFLAYTSLIEDPEKRSFALKSLFDLHTKYMSGYKDIGAFAHTSSSSELLPAINPVMIARIAIAETVENMEDILLFLQKHNLLSHELPLDGLIVATHDNKTQDNIHKMLQFYLSKQFSQEEQLAIISTLFLDKQRNCRNDIITLCTYNQRAAILLANHIIKTPNLLEVLYPVVIGIIASIEKNEAEKLFRFLSEQKIQLSDYRLEEILNNILFNSINEISVVHSINKFWHAQYISEALKYRKNIIKFELSSCVSKEVVECFAQNLVTFEEIEILNSDIAVTGANKIADALRSNTIIRSLKLFIGSIGAIGAKVVADALLNNNSLTKLDLYEQLIGDDGAISIAALLAQSKITELCLPSNNIQAKGTQGIAEALTTSILTFLKLSYNRIGNDGVSALAGGLKSNSTLVQLELVSNKITGAESLFEALTQNTTLKTLALDLNKIHGLGKHTINALKNNRALQNLSLRRNELDYEDAKVIAEGLKDNEGLTSLNLEENKIQDSGIKAIAGALAQNRKLSKLNLRETQIGEEGAIDIAKALETNTSLTELDLRANQIGNKGATAFAEALKINNSLTKLYLWSNQIEYEGALDIVNALEGNNSLQFLELDLYTITKEIVDHMFNTIKSDQSRVTPIECTIFTKEQNANLRAQAEWNATRNQGFVSSLQTSQQSTAWKREHF